MEVGVTAPSRGPGPLRVGAPADDRYADTGRLLITCPDRPGIGAAVSSFLSGRDANIIESQQFSPDPFGGTFFLRVEFCLRGLAEQRAGLAGEFGALADRFSMRWRLIRAAELKRVAIMVSKTDHVLQRR